ncbi:centrosomal protein of 78 kDa-like isoform X2 [Lytechinus variegatus]|uniref:centrosomal protein of 78 kDa-like isoform X2 n=1 Tax=Lytechinus variegatus TaxID=7654 RepID=UPI001BB15A5B|nr:centrosomal protein of 78 kDa-like isoform X2 [Lytechinus variegatus]
MSYMFNGDVMAMIESVKARRRGAQDFEGYYSQLCALQDSCPLTAVKAHLDDGILDLNADRVRQPDWMPILNALRINRSLQFVAFRSYYQSAKQDDSRSHLQTQVRRPPPIRSRDIAHRLCIALRECLANSEQLQHLELQGLLLREKNVVSLCKGLAKSRCLQHLSLEYCRIGDRGVEVLCQCIKNAPTIVSLNLTAAGLTWKSADMIAKLVKHQATRRHTEAWKDSLRYRRPDLDRMPGIRRITMNNNPLLNDKGAMALAEALKDDLWLKALDMQHCGISNAGAKAFLDTLHQNTSIVVLDLRRNPLLDQDLLKAIIEQVMINSGGQEVEYKWLRARSPSGPSSKQRNKRKGRTSSTQIKKVSSSSRSTVKSSIKPERRTRSKSESGIIIHSSKTEMEPVVKRPGPGFVPWRTAARANQRSKSIVHIEPGSPDGSSTPTRPGASSIHVHVGNSSEVDTSIKDSIDTPSTHLSTGTGATYEATVNRKIKNLQVEAEELRRRLYIESKARAASDERVIELEVENSRLKHQLQLLEARGPTSPLKKGGQVEEENGEDEALLESIEESFQKFHSFLDLLRDAGLGQLCTLVGLSTQDISHPTVKSILKNHQPSTQSGPASSSAQQTHSVYQPGNLIYSNHPIQPSPYNVPFGAMGPLLPVMLYPNQTSSPGAGNVNFQQALGAQPVNMGIYPQMMSTYPQQMPMMQGQMPQVNQPLAPQLHMYQQPMQPVLANQQSSSAGISNGGLQPVTSSTSQSKQSRVDNTSTSGASTQVTVSSQRPIPVTSKSESIPLESMSSTEGVFMPSVVQISQGSGMSEDKKQPTSGTTLPTVLSKADRQVSPEVDERDGQNKEDSLHDHPGSHKGSPLALGEELGLQKVEDSFESDIGNIRQMTELDFGESIDSTPRIPDTKYSKDSPRVESATPTKGIGSPTESDHSGRGPPRGASPIQSYSEDFEGEADEDESEIEEDLFKDSEGSLPGLTSDDEF